MKLAGLLGYAVFVVCVAGCGDDGGGADIDAGPDAPIGDAPTVTITSHTDGQQIFGTRMVTIAGSLADTNAITGVTVTVGTAPPVAATFDQTSFSLSVALADNVHTVTVTATDATALSGSDDVSLDYPFVSLTTFQTATLALGQPDLTSSGARGADASRIRDMYGRGTELDGTIFIADSNGDRVLGFRGFPAQDDAAADFVLGQPNLIGARSGTSASLMNGPQSIATHEGKLYVLEYSNSRITVWSTAPTTSSVPADAVIGQVDLMSNSNGCTSTSFHGPEDLTIAGGKLVVADSNNNRVLIWNSVPAAAGVPADIVLGQSDFTHCADDDDDQDGTNDGMASARTVAYPAGVWTDGTRLVVADLDNSRVLIWNTFPTTSFQPADLVLGQADATANEPDAAADRFAYPYAVESNGNQLFVADSENNRVMVWNTFPTSNVAADVVLGQGDFTHATANDDDQNATSDAAPTARTLNYPDGVYLIRDRLFVGDNSNNRVLVFGPAVCTPNTGLFEFPAGSGTCIDDPCVASACTNYRTCDRSTGAAVCTCPEGITGDCDTCIRYVDPDATGAGTGATWTDAYTALSPALADASDATMPCDVWATEGTYYIRSAADTDTLRLGGTVALRGGFAGTETSAASRSGGATILDGRDSAAGATDVHHVVTVESAGTTRAPELDGLTIQYGNADGTGDDANGGGVLVANGARVTLTACTVENNRAAGRGGGLYNTTGGATAALLDDTTFRNNTAGILGGGAQLGGGTITSSTFENNTVGTAVGHTGGALQLTGTGSITGSTFRRNRATGDAGAIHVTGAQSAWSITSSTFVSNQANNGGAIYFDASGGSSGMSTCVLTGNVALGTAGAVFVRDSAPALTNLTVAGNIAVQGNPGIGNSGSSGAYANLVVWGNAGNNNPQVNANGQTVTYSDIAGGHAGTGNIDVDPQFVHAPTALDRVVTQDTAATITVTTGARFAVGDHVEIGNDGVDRTIAAVAANLLTFTPALAASPLDVTVENWGTAPTNLEADYHLGAGSPCIDAGTPAGTDMGAYP